jgi:uncharacterized protein (TIGR00266 family)
MAKQFKYTMHGDDLQLVEITLEPDGCIRAETGTMAFMEDDIEMETSSGGGVLRGLQRAMAGEGFFITDFTNRGSKNRQVAFAAPYPGKIINISLDPLENEFFCQRDAFLCADANIEIEIALTRRIGAGLLGGEGFILQKLSGSGTVFLHAGGTVIKKSLAEGESLRVDTGCIVAFSSKIDYDIQFVGGFRNALFGGEGLFLALLKGPGDVYLQSLPFSRLAARIRMGLSRQAAKR